MVDHVFGDTSIPRAPQRPSNRVLGIITACCALIVLITTLAGIGPASSETPAERCARETSAYNAAWAASWAAANPGQSPSNAPPPPVPYVCAEPQDPTTTPTSPPATTPGLPEAEDTGSGPNVGAHAPTDIPTPGDTPIVTVAPNTPRGQPGTDRPGGNLSSASPQAPRIDVPGRRPALLGIDCPIGKNPDGSCRGHSAINGSGEEVTVPDDYIYDPDCKQMPEGRDCIGGWKFMHDYCSGSPDQLPSPGANADFRGPCARHDQCLERGGTNASCNQKFHENLYQNCKYTYGAADPRRAYCDKNADAYFSAVTALQPPIPGRNGPIIGG
jgi:hypothetical protein